MLNYKRFLTLTQLHEKNAENGKNCTKKMQISRKTAQKECNYDINGLSDDIFIAGQVSNLPLRVLCCRFSKHLYVLALRLAF